MKSGLRLIVIAIVFLIAACQSKKPETVLVEESLPIDLASIGKEKLSDYGFFTGLLKDLSPAEGVIPYSINAALFSDYAFKQRFIKIPEGQYATYSSDVPTTRHGVPNAFDPVGISVITKLLAPITTLSPIVTPLATTVLGPR